VYDDEIAVKKALKRLLESSKPRRVGNLSADIKELWSMLTGQQ
jgi:hypothetical protein